MDSGAPDINDETYEENGEYNCEQQPNLCQSNSGELFMRAW